MSEQQNAGRAIKKQGADAGKGAAGQEATSQAPVMNRREFLAWAMVGSTALLTAVGGVTMVLPDPKSDPLMQGIIPAGQDGTRPIVGGFAYPRIKEGTFGGKFILDRKAKSYTTEERPELDAVGKFYTVKVDELMLDNDGAVAGDQSTKIMAIYQVCTHLGCLVPFDGGQNRFICPCHGSTFERDSEYVLGPAPRNMDQFEVAVADDGTVTVDTGRKRTGKHHA